MCWRCLAWMAVVTAFPPPALGGQISLNGHEFTLADGFEIEQVAGPPLVDRPICGDFDEQGRLYVADSSGSNEPVKLQLEKKPHRIVRLEDVDGDGRFDESVVFADRLMFPEGTLWYDGSLYVAAPPEIWKLTDTDDDGVADQRNVWFDGQTLTGCANDLHGPYLGPDGWIYWCKGAFAEQSYERADGSTWKTRAAHIFRRRPDGGPIEPVMTGGMDNPVEVIFTPAGERIFTTTLFQHTAGGRRDGLVHAIYGGVYGKPHGVLDGHPRTGPLMPVLLHLGVAAPCGLVQLQSDAWGAEYQHNLLASLFNLRKVTRHVLQPAGASFSVTQEVLLESDQLDFHPTDVFEDADGSLLVIDTGGWYKLCCPTSKVAKPEVLGAIYRVRRAGAEAVDDPRGTLIDWDAVSLKQLASLLADSRFAVRERARRRLGSGGREAVPVLRPVLDQSRDARQRLLAVWALSNISGSEARAATRTALDDTSLDVRVAALHAISAWRDAAAERQVLTSLRSGLPHERRVAAEALGRIGSHAAVPEILAAARDCEDRVLEHSLVYALIEIAAPENTRAALAGESPAAIRAALLALDQMPHGDLTAEETCRWLNHEDVSVQEAAEWIADRHPDWGAALVDHFRELIAGHSDTPESAVLGQRLARFAAETTIQQLIGDALRQASTSQGARRALLDAIAASRLTQLPPDWADPLHELLAVEDAGVLDKTVEACRVLGAASSDERIAGRLQAIAGDPRQSPLTRLRALTALPEGQQRVDAATLELLCRSLDVDQALPIRSRAVDVLRGAALDAEQLAHVADTLPSTGPIELVQLVELFADSSDEELGLRLVESLEQCSSATALSADDLREQLSRYGESVLARSGRLLNRVEEAQRDAQQRIEELLPLVAKGDVVRGQAVFRSTKAACTACHAMAHLGGRAGPDLTRIGGIRSERDLLEAILFPSAAFVRSYEPTDIVTRDGRVFSGVVRDETDSELTLQIDAEKVVRIQSRDIEERNHGETSIMPAGLDKQFTPQELADLVKYLKSAQ